MPTLPVSTHMRTNEHRSSVGSAGPVVDVSFGEVDEVDVAGSSVWATSFEDNTHDDHDDDDDNDDDNDDVGDGNGNGKVPLAAAGKRKRAGLQKRAQKTQAAAQRTKERLAKAAQRAKEQLKREQRLAYCVQVCLDKGWG